MGAFLLKLYIAGHTPRSATAIANLRRICEEAIPGQHEMVIIDVLECPQLAEEAKVLVTPTLVRAFPLPLRRIVGDLSNTARVLQCLEIPRRQEERRLDTTVE
jgi:circadian clock protein KaiB